MRRRDVVVGAVAGSLLTMLATGCILNASVFDLKDLAKLNSFARFVGQNYYKDVDEEVLKNGVYEGLFAELDRYSDYLTVDEYTEMKESEENEKFYGVGIGYNQSKYTDAFRVVYVYPGSPAERAGVLEGDVLDSVDGVYLYDKDLEDVSDLVRGAKGTVVSLGVYRGDDLLKFDLERDEVSAEFAVAEMLDDRTGYIKIREFNENTVASFSKCMSVVDGCDNLIIDLQSNPGGDLKALVGVLEQLVPKCRVCTLHSKVDGDEVIELTNGVEMSYNLAVLVNSSSASCSEIFASVIQDNNFGVLIGQTTFGKGVWQALIALKDGDAVKLTLGEYLTSSGRSIDEVGVVPDIEIRPEEDTLQCALDYFYQR